MNPHFFQGLSPAAPSAGEVAARQSTSYAAQRFRVPRWIVLRPAAGQWRLLRGRLHDRDTPAGPYRVTLSSPALLHALDSTVGADGAFEFRVPPGSYELDVTPGQTYARTRITVTAADVTDVEVVRARQVDVVGRILLDRRVPTPELGLAFVRPDGTIRTIMESDGRFFTRLPAGQHRVIATQLPRGYSIRSIAAGETDLLAQPLDVPGVRPAEIVISVAVDETVRVVRLSGRVMGLDGAQAAGARVRLSGPFHLVAQEAPIAADGGFGFERVVPGSYTLQLTASSSGGQLRLPRSSVSVEVGATDVTGVELRVPGPVPVTAVVDVEGEAPLPWMALGFRTAGGYQSINNIGNAAAAFEGVLSAGEHRVEVSGISTGYTVESMAAGDSDLLAKPLVVTDSPVSLRVRVRAALPVVSVSGRLVLRDDSGTMPRAIALAPPMSGLGASLPGRQTSFGLPSVHATVGSDGSFAFPHVLAGTYSASFEPEEVGQTRRVRIDIGSSVSGLEILVPRWVEVAWRVDILGDGPRNFPRVTFAPDPTTARDQMGRKHRTRILRAPRARSACVNNRHTDVVKPRRTRRSRRPPESDRRILRAPRALGGRSACVNDRHTDVVKPRRT